MSLLSFLFTLMDFLLGGETVGFGGTCERGGGVVEASPFPHLPLIRSWCMQSSKCVFLLDSIFSEGCFGLSFLPPGTLLFAGSLEVYPYAASLPALLLFPYFLFLILI